MNKEFEWNYGGHHHESLLTNVVSSYLPNKFNIDRRLTSGSAMVRSKLISKICKKFFHPTFKKKMKKTYEYILDKLDISLSEYKNFTSSKIKILE